jgi:hypothetical protein
MKAAVIAAAVAALAAPSFAETLEEKKAAPFAVTLDREAQTPPIDETAPVQDAEFAPAGTELPPHIRFEQPVFIKPKVGPAASSVGRGLGGFKLADRLNSHTDMFTRKLGSRDWDLSVAGDAKFETAYLLLTRPDEQQLHKIKDIGELRKKGVNVKIDERTVYNFKISVNIFSPTRGSKLKMTPIAGTQGPKHSIKTGRILDRTREKSFVFKTGGKEFWMLYGTDVDPETNWFADTRSFLIIHEDGLSSKAWPIGEASLEPGKAVTVDLEGTRVVMRRGTDGTLALFEPGKTVGPIAMR